MATYSHYDDETGLVKISWSKIRRREECPQKDHRITLGAKSPLTDVRVFLQGNIVDRAMRRWLSMDHPPNGWMAIHLAEIAEDTEREIRETEDGTIRWKHLNDRAQVMEFCMEAVVRLEPLLRQLVMQDDYQPAVRFKTKLNIPGLDGNTTAVLLTGEMDVLTRREPELPGITLDPDPLVLALPRMEMRCWDLKVTRDASYWRKTVAQLVFYDIACICMTGLPLIEAGLIQPMVEGAPFMSFRPSDEDRTQMFTRIVSVAHGVMRGDFAPKADSIGCDRCEARNACDKYAPVPGSKRIPLF